MCAVDGTAVDGTAVDGTAGTDGLSSGDGPLLDTTHIIIVAVAAFIGSLVACGVLLLIILLCVLAKRERKRNMSTKPDVESDGSSGKEVPTNTVVSFRKNSNEVNIEDSGSRRNQRSGSKSQPPNGANRKLPPVQAADKNKAVGNKLATRDSRPNVDPIDTDRAGLRKKTNGGPSRSLPTDPRGGMGGTRNTNPGGVSGRQGFVTARATRPAPRPPPGANRPPAPKAPGKVPVSKSLTTTTRKNSSNLQRPTNSLTTLS